MGFGNGAFQNAKIAIDNYTLVLNEYTGKVQAVALSAGANPSSATLPILITNGQSSPTPSNFQVYIPIKNISQFGRASSDLSNIYFSSDPTGDNKLYSWRETGTSSADSEVAYWVLLPGGINANSNITIYVQFSTSTAIDGNITGIAPWITSTYAEYDNGANIFPNYYNFSGTSLPSDFTSAASSDASVSVNNGIKFTSGTSDGPSYSYIVSTTALGSNLIAESVVSSVNQIITGGVNYDFAGFSSSATVGQPGGSGTNNNFSTYVGASFYSGNVEVSLGLFNNSSNFLTAYTASYPSTGLVFGSYENPVSAFLNYELTSSSAGYSGSLYLLSGIASAGSLAALPTSGQFSLYVIRTRLYPPNGIMPLAKPDVQNFASYTQSNTWTAPQTFEAETTFNSEATFNAEGIFNLGTAGSADIGALYAYVANYGSDSVSVINTATNTVTTTISVGGRPDGIAISPNGLYAYAANSTSNSVSVINTATNTVINTISNVKNAATSAVSPNGLYVYSTDGLYEYLYVIDTKTNTIIATVTVGASPYSVAVNPNGLYVYVANSGTTGVSVINTATNTVTTTVTVGSSPIAIAISPNGLYAYVANYGSDSVSVINTATNTVTTTISVGGSPDGIAVSPNGLYVYVANYGSGSVSVINTATNTVTTTVTVGSGPDGIAVSPNGLYVYVANSTSDSVSVINTATNTVTTTVTVGKSPIAIAITPSQTLATASLSAQGILHNRQYHQSLTAVTTTSTSAVLITGASLSITPNSSGYIIADAVVRASNDTLSDGVVVSLYSGASSGALTNLLTSETYTQEGLAGNEHTFHLHYESYEPIGTAVYYSLALNTVTGGTASAKVQKLAVAEYPDFA